MSDPTRYRVANNQAQLTLGGGILAVDPAGPLVMYDDYARLKADVNELADGLKLASEVGIKIADEVTRLKAEVERLRKAGDGMEEVIWLTGCVSGMEIKERAVKAWKQAKEGKV